jgi:hypothetical protein
MTVIENSKYIYSYKVFEFINNINLSINEKKIYYN